jgi:SAM-dependent methyltransferase
MNSGILNGLTCQVCGEEALRETGGFGALVRVASDSTPWPAGGRLCVCEACGLVQKVVDDRWLAEITEIYRRYALYHQADGAEQPIFSGTGPARPRSALLAELVGRTVPLADDIAMLDCGCGNGDALCAFAALHPGWSLHGHDVRDAARKRLKDIPNFKGLFTGDIAKVSGKFGLITLIHALEHILDPVATLRRLRGLLAPQGVLFVQVPDCGVNAYDLVITDHLSHFTIQGLPRLMERAGFSTTFLSDCVLPKELTWIGVAAQERATTFGAQADAGSSARVERQLAWLRAQADAAAVCADSSAKFGIFGTSISATWLAGAMGDRVAFFVDEDPGRVGRSHMGRPIVSPQGAPVGSDIYIPLLTGVAKQVAARIGALGLRCHTPPEFDPI